MQDFRELKMFCRAGRGHLQDILEFLLRHWQLVALVPVFQGGLTVEQNVRNLREAGRAEALKHHQKLYLYSGDTGLIVLFGLDKGRRAFLEYIEATVKQYHQVGYVLWDGSEARLISAGGERTLASFDGTLERLDEWAGALIPGFTTEGEFDRSISYVQMRDHQTRPK